MADISKCNDIHCPSKRICYRFTATPSEFRQSWIQTNRQADAYNCNLFYPNDKAEQKNTIIEIMKFDEENNLY